MARRTGRKKILSEREATDVAQAFRALSDPTRVRILAAILDEERCVHDLCEELDLEQSTVSHQLRHLRGQELVENRKDGRHVYYRLDDAHVQRLLTTAFEHVLDEKKGRTS